MLLALDSFKTQNILCVRAFFVDVCCRFVALNCEQTSPSTLNKKLECILRAKHRLNGWHTRIEEGTG